MVTLYASSALSSAPSNKEATFSLPAMKKTCPSPKVKPLYQTLTCTWDQNSFLFDKQVLHL